MELNRNNDMVNTNTLIDKDELSINAALEKFYETCFLLESGKIRVAEQVDGQWVVNSWIKEVILSGFKFGKMVDMSQGGFSFFDKETLSLKQFEENDKVRIVPGGTSVRIGAYLAPSVIIMPPSYVNIGAFVDKNTLIDSHALVGSCAQIGKNVHLSAASQIGGVLEPVGALPVIIEDNVFIGGNCGIYEGTIVKKNAVIATGVIVNSSTPIYDAVNDRYIKKNEKGQMVVPEGAVVVAGSRPINKGGAVQEGIHVYCPVIVKYRDEKTSSSIVLEDLLR